MTSCIIKSVYSCVCVSVTLEKFRVLRDTRSSDSVHALLARCPRYQYTFKFIRIWESKRTRFVCAYVYARVRVGEWKEDESEWKPTCAIAESFPIKEFLLLRSNLPKGRSSWRIYDAFFFFNFSSGFFKIQIFLGYHYIVGRWIKLAVTRVEHAQLAIAHAIKSSRGHCVTHSARRVVRRCLRRARAKLKNSTDRANSTCPLSNDNPRRRRWTDTGFTFRIPRECSFSSAG